MSLHQRITSRLAELERTHLLRKRVVVDADYDGIIQVEGKSYLNFSSNDYLGLRHDQRVLQSFTEGLAQHGSSAGASALVTGHNIEHARLERYLAQALQREAVLLFSSGFAANQAVCMAILHKGDAVISDKLMHASFIEAAMHSPAYFTRFKHNDMAEAQRVLSSTMSKQATSDAVTLCATEGVFSMDGDSGNVAELAQVCAAHQATFMVDDAHAFGVIGETGLGSVEQCHLSQEDAPIVMGTFGKAIGTTGAFIAGSQVLIDYLVNHARHTIYSTAMPAANARATLTSIELMREGEQRHRLQTNIQFFKEQAKLRGLSLMRSDSAIQPVLVGCPKKALAMSQALKSLGVWVNAIRSPTVPPKQDRLRITLSAVHQENDIISLLDALHIVRAKIDAGE